MIPVSTTASDPVWYHEGFRNPNRCFIDKRNVMNGIREERLHFRQKDFNALTEPCQKDCPYRDKVPNCQFMISYSKYLHTLDFNSLLLDLESTAEEVRKVTHFEGEPIVVLIVYEAAKCACAERPCIKQWFADNGYDLKEWSKDIC